MTRSREATSGGGRAPGKVLITGGAGYIGSHCAKLMAAAGHEVVVLDDLRNGHERNVRWGPLERVDLVDRDAVHEALQRQRPDTVIHFAALAYVGESMQRPEDYFRCNVVGSLNLLDAMRAAGVRDIVFSSTCATYGVPERMPITEDTPQRPVNPYGESKLMVERLLRWYGEVHGIRHAALRYFNVAGADPDGELGEEHDPETHLIPLAIFAALGERAALQIFGDDYPTDDGSAVRDYIHVVDLCEAHRLALQALRAGRSALRCNLGTGTGSSVRAVIAAVERVAGQAVPHETAPRRPGDPPILVADPALAERELGWRARYRLDDMVAHAWRWFDATSPTRNR